jgi:glutathione synthase/RimK-type ligase-like ATP-grasp enzyme
MTLSGFAGYGKHEDMDKFDTNLLPITVFIRQGHDTEHIEHQMKQHSITYPCIAKPTLGRTGRDVNKIHTTDELKTYLKRVHEDILIQEFIDDPLEF